MLGSQSIVPPFFSQEYSRPHAVRGASTDKHRSLPLFPNHFVIFNFPTLVDAEVIRSPYFLRFGARLY